MLNWKRAGKPKVSLGSRKAGSLTGLDQSRALAEIRGIVRITILWVHSLKAIFTSINICDTRGVSHVQFRRPH